MKYRVLERLSYDGKIYESGEEIDILEMYVSNLKKRGLIEDIIGKRVEEIKPVDSENTDNGVDVMSGTEETELTEAELSKLNKEKLIELANSKEITINEELTKKEIIKLILGD